MYMPSFEAFCHEKTNQESAIFLLFSKDGFIQLPEAYEELFEKGLSSYEGLAAINGFNLLDPSNNALAVEEFSSCRIISPKAERAIDTGNAVLSNRLEVYSKERNLSVAETIFLQKMCLSLSAKLTSGCKFVYLDLKGCEDAPLALDAVKFFFEGSDLIFSLPHNLQFALPRPMENEVAIADGKGDAEIDLADGYQTFFDDVCGISSPNFETFKKRKKRKPAVQKEETPKIGPKTDKKEDGYLEKGMKVQLSVKKDYIGDLAFSLFFAALSIAAPYFYFTLLNDAANVYFVIYTILDVFFLVMSSFAICYLMDLKAKITRGLYWFGLAITPFIVVPATAAFFFLSKRNQWLGTECYAFIGLGFGFLLIHCLVLLLHKMMRASKRKAGD